MFGKYVSVTLIGLLLNLTLYSTAAANTEKEVKFAEQVKANIIKLGTGKESRVKIKLKNGTKLKGFVSEIKDSSFVLTNAETGNSEEIQYLQVKKAQGSNSKTGQRILVVVVIIGLIVLLAWGAARGN